MIEQIAFLFIGKLAKKIADKKNSGHQPITLRFDEINEHIYDFTFKDAFKATLMMNVIMMGVSIFIFMSKGSKVPVSFVVSFFCITSLVIPFLVHLVLRFQVWKLRRDIKKWEKNVGFFLYKDVYVFPPTKLQLFLQKILYTHTPRTVIDDKGKKISMIYRGDMTGGFRAKMLDFQSITTSTNFTFLLIPKEGETGQTPVLADYAA